MQIELLFLTNGSNMTALIQNVFLRKFVVKPSTFNLLEVECSVDDGMVGLVVIEVTGISTREIEAFKAIKEEFIDPNDLPVFLMGSTENKYMLNQFTQFKGVINLANLKINDVYDEIVKYINAKNKKVSKKKIMLVDDDPMILRYMGGALKEYYDVVMAPSGTLAIELLGKTNPPPDLILLDYQMPQLDGAQTLNIIRRAGEFENIPVFFLTGVNDRESILKVMLLKPQGYILKTLPQQEILKKINGFFEQ